MIDKNRSVWQPAKFDACPKCGLLNCGGCSWVKIEPQTPTGFHLFDLNAPNKLSSIHRTVEAAQAAVNVPAEQWTPIPYSPVTPLWIHGSYIITPVYGEIP